MITDYQVQRKGKTVILGIAVRDAVMDIVTNENLMQQCLQLLDNPHRGLVNAQMGQFGDFAVTLNLHDDDSVSIFVDGPEFDGSRTQSAVIWVGKKELQQLLLDVLSSR